MPILKLFLYCFVYLLLYFPSKPYALGWSGSQLNNQACQGNEQGFGPFDYELVIRSKGTPLWKSARLWEVNKIHYGKGLNLLKDKGINKFTFNPIQNEFDYTLRAFPNHTEALYSTINLELKRISMNKIKKENLSPFKTPPECYLQRALTLKPQQANLHLLFAIYLQKLKKKTLAKHYYLNALRFGPSNPEINYNYGLLLVDMRDIKEAKKQAKIAKKGNYPLKGLENKINSLSKELDR